MTTDAEVALLAQDAKRNAAIVARALELRDAAQATYNDIVAAQTAAIAAHIAAVEQFNTQLTDLVPQLTVDYWMAQAADDVGGAT